MRIRAEQVLDTIAKQVSLYLSIPLHRVMQKDLHPCRYSRRGSCAHLFKSPLQHWKFPNELRPSQIKDPVIISHWNSLNSPTQSCVRLTIVSHGFDFMCRTSLMVQVLQKSFRCICKDGKVMNLSYESQELRDLILCQVSIRVRIYYPSVSGILMWTWLADIPPSNGRSSEYSEKYGMATSGQHAPSWYRQCGTFG